MFNKLSLLGPTLLRITFGLGLATHGLMKFENYATLSQRFPDILGIGPAGNLALCIFAELFCAVLVALGLFTRIVSIPVIINMAVAFFVVHSADPFAKKEMSMLYLSGFATIFLIGSGSFALQSVLPLKKFSGWKGFFLESNNA